MAELAAKAREEMATEGRAEDDGRRGHRRARFRRRRAATSPRRRRSGPTSTSTPPTWWSSSAAPNSGRTARRAPGSRWRSTTSCRRPACSSWRGPPAWSSGRTIPTPGWYDTETGELVDEGELVERYHDAVIDRVGIREFVDDGAIDADHAAPLLVSVFLDKDFTFVVSVGGRGQGVRPESDPEHTVIAPVQDSGDWQVTRKAGTEIRVPRKTKLSRTVGAQIPTGFDPMVYGVSQDMMNVDRPGGDVEPRHHRRCVPVRRVHADRADALGAPQPGGQHAGHRYGRHDVDADHVPRQPAGPEQAQRHPAGGPAERRSPATSCSPTSAATAR